MEENLSFEDGGKLLRILDSGESRVVDSWLSVSGTVPKSIITPQSAIENIHKKYSELLKDFPTLRLRLSFIDKKPYFKIAENSELKFDNLVKKLENITPLYDELPEKTEMDKTSLWQLEISETEGEKTKLRLKMNHAIIDGRCIFDVLDIFYYTAVNKPFPERLNSYRNQPMIYDFGKKSFFTDEIINIGFKEPEAHFKAIHAELTPPITLPSHVIQPQWEVPYPPISAFCKKHKVTCQAIIIAIQNEAIRLYHKGKFDDIPLFSFTPVDNRKNPYATELLKKSLFFYHIGDVLPVVYKKDNPLENILHCSEKFQEAYKTKDACISGYSRSNFTNEKGERVNNFTKPFHPNKANFIFGSHIGLVGTEMDNLHFLSDFPISPYFYVLYLYGFHNLKTFYFSVNAPYNVPKELFDTYKDVTMKYYDFIVNDIKENKEKE